MGMKRAVVPPRQERSEESTQRLLDAAAERLAEVGYAGMTLAEVGTRAGYSRSLVTARFGSKQGLLGVLVDRLSEGWAPFFVQPPAADDGLGSLVAMVRAVGRGISADPTSLRVLQRLIFESAAPTSPLHRQFAAATTKLQRDVAAVLRRGVTDGSIRPDIDPDAEAAVIVATLRGLSYEWFLYPSLVEVEVQHETYVGQLRRSLAPGP